MDREEYPPGTFVTVSMEYPHHGQLRVHQLNGPSRVLWECEHAHPTGEEAAACAGREIGRDGKT